MKSFLLFFPVFRDAMLLFECLDSTVEIERATGGRERGVLREILRDSYKIETEDKEIKIVNKKDVSAIRMPQFVARIIKK